MTYSRPWMFCGWALMPAGAVLLCQQGCRPGDQETAKNTVGSDSSRRSPRKPQEARRLESPPTKPPPANSLPTKSAPTESPPEKTRPAISPAADPSPWKSLFDGKTLTGWKSPQFGGDGKVYVKDGMIVMERGGMMTGVTWTGEVPRNNYELALEGMRLDGSDFFCTTTFPVGNDPCSLVVGGWGGSLVGLSSIDFQDASENATSSTMEFKNRQWYRVRIRVTDAAVEAWIGDQQVVKQPREDHKFSIRMEVESCRPLGIATWDTAGAVRNIRIRNLDGKRS
jgi:hypothetical protein